MSIRTFTRAHKRLFYISLWTTTYLHHCRSSLFALAGITVSNQTLSYYDQNAYYMTISVTWCHSNNVHTWHVVCADCFYNVALKVQLIFNKTKRRFFFFYFLPPFLCVHLSYCSMIYDDDHFRSCHEQSHHEKYIFFPPCLFSSLSSPVLSVEICQSEKEWRMATTDCFKTLRSKSERKCTYVAQYLQLCLKIKCPFFSTL